MKNQEFGKSKNLRQKLLMIYHEDGILDMVVGAVILLLAVVMAFEGNAFIGLIGIPIIFYIPIKERVSIPRIGYIRFEANEETRKKLYAYLAAGVGMLFVFALIILLRVDRSSGLAEFISNNLVPVFAIFLAGTLFVVGRVMSNGRFVIYAALSLVLVFAAYFLHLRMWIPVTALGVVIAVVAASKLVSFLQNYPLADGE